MHVLVPQQAGGQRLGGSSQRTGQKGTAFKLKKIKALVKQGLEGQSSGEERLRWLEEKVAEGRAGAGVEQQMQHMQNRLDAVVGEMGQLRELLAAVLTHQQHQYQQQQQQQPAGPPIAGQAT